MLYEPEQSKQRKNTFRICIMPGVNYATKLRYIFSIYNRQFVKIHDNLTDITKKKAF